MNERCQPYGSIEKQIYRSLIILLSIIILICQFSVKAHSAQATLAWNPPVNADGTLFTGFAGYKLLVGTASGNYTESIDVGNATSYVHNNLSDGLTYYFTVVDYDSSGNLSGYSNEVSKSFPFIYTLTATAGTGGSITPVGNATTSTATNGSYTITSVTVTKNSTMAFSIVPNSGYTISSVAVDSVPAGTVNSYTFSNITADHTLTAAFTAIPASFTLTATAGTGGSITPSGTATVNSGSSQSYSITPGNGYRIADVKVDGVSVGAVSNYTLSNVTANHTISATFAVVTYSITAIAGTGGSITPSGTATVNSGSSQSYSITPGGGYRIADVKVDGVSVGAVSNYTLSNVTANHTISAMFASAVQSYTISATAGTGGAVSPAGTVTLTAGASQTYYVTPNLGYYTVSVTVDGSAVASNLGTYSYTFSNVATNHSLAATFGVCTYTISASAGTGGKISSAGSSTVTYNSSKTYSITPRAGYRISNVSVDGVSVGAVTTYTFNNINANHKITATFSRN